MPTWACTTIWPRRTNAAKTAWYGRSKIRTDAKFTDGEALTAEDVAFTINGIKDAPSSEADLPWCHEAVALDDETVEIRMAHPFNILVYTLATVGICPAHAHGADYGSNPIGSGRYKLAQWDRGQQVIFEANPDYYGEAPKMQRVVVVFMEEDASLAAAQSGQVDLAYTSASLADAAPAGFQLFSVKTVDSRGISLPVVPAGAQAHGRRRRIRRRQRCDVRPRFAPRDELRRRSRAFDRGAPSGVMRRRRTARRTACRGPART